MYLKDFPKDKIAIGMELRSLRDSNVIGYIEELAIVRGELLAWIKWPHRNSKESYVYCSSCMNEVVEEEEKP